MRSLFVALLIPGLSFAGVNVPTPEPQTQTQNQAQGQQQAQGQSQQAQSGASLELNYKERLQIPAAPAVFAPSMSPSAPCALTNSKGFSLPIGGATKGSSLTDPNCDRREAARILTPLNPGLALKVMCSDPYVAAVAAPEDCVLPSVPTGTPEVTKADLEAVKNELREESIKRTDTAFRQSQKK